MLTHLRGLGARIGIVPRLVAVTLLAVGAAVAAIQVVELRSYEQLTLGGQPVEGRNDLVDTVKRVAGGVATIFQGDLRIATNVQRPDGSRGVGTRLAAGAAYDAALTRGQTYRGMNDILGRPHFTVYEPIRDAAGRQVGLLFVGVPAAEVAATVAERTRAGIINALVVLALVGAVIWFSVVRAMRPLGGIGAAIDAIAQGRADVAVPCRDRADQLGVIARSVETLREATLRAGRAEQEATAARAQAEQARHAAAAAAAATVQDRIGAVATSLAAATRRLAEASGELAAGADAPRSPRSPARSANPPPPRAAPPSRPAPPMPACANWPPRPRRSARW